MAVAELGYVIDSSGAVVAADNLDDMAAAAKRAEVGAKGVGTAAGVASKKSFLAGNGFRQMALQLNRVESQTAASGDLLRSFTIQLPDLLLGFGTMGIVLGALAPAIVGLGSGLVGASHDADAFGDNLSDLSDAISEYKEAAVTGAGASRYLVENFGNITRETIALSAAMQELRVREIMLNAADAANMLADTFSGGLRSELARLNALLGEGKDWWDSSTEAAQQFAAKLDAVRMAQGPEAQLAAVRSMRDEFVKITGGIDNMTDAQRDYYGEILRTEQALSSAVNLTFDAADATGDWDARMQGVRVELGAIASIINSLGGGAISAAAKQTEITALRAGKTIKQAAVAASEFKENLRVDAEVAQLEARYGVVGVIMGAAVKKQSEYNQELDRTLDTERTAAIEREKAANKASRSGAAAGKKENNEYTRDLDSLIESMRTERETVDAWYEESQALLNDRRSIELLGVQGHNDAKLALEAEYSSRLVDLKNQEAEMVKTAASSMYGELSTLLTSFGTKSKAAAVAALALNTALRISEVMQNTAAASVRALAELGPVAGAAAAAKIMTFGKLQAGLILANSALSAGSIGGGASSSGVSATASASSAPSATSTATTTATPTKTIVQIQSSRRSFTVEEINDIIAGIQDEAGDGVIIEGFTLS